MLQSSTSESSVSVSSTTNLSTVSSQRVSASSATNMSTASSMTNVSSQQATTSTKGRRAKVLPNLRMKLNPILRCLCQTSCAPPATATTLRWWKIWSESSASSLSHRGKELLLMCTLWIQYITLRIVMKNWVKSVNWTFCQCDSVNNSCDQWRGQENPQPAEGIDAGIAVKDVHIVCAQAISHLVWLIVKSCISLLLSPHWCWTNQGLLVVDKGVGLLFFGGGKVGSWGTLWDGQLQSSSEFLINLNLGLKYIWSLAQRFATWGRRESTLVEPSNLSFSKVAQLIFCENALIYFWLHNCLPDVGTVYVSGECRAPKDELRQLILSGGTDSCTSLKTDARFKSFSQRWFCGKYSPSRLCGGWRVQRPWREPVMISFSVWELSQILGDCSQYLTRLEFALICHISLCTDSGYIPKGSVLKLCWCFPGPQIVSPRSGYWTQCNSTW